MIIITICHKRGSGLKPNLYASHRKLNQASINMPIAFRPICESRPAALLVLQPTVSDHNIVSSNEMLRD